MIKKYTSNFNTHAMKAARRVTQEVSAGPKIKK